MSKAHTTRLSIEDFTTRAINSLRTDKSKGIHTRFSGFNSAFRQYYGEDYDPVAEVQKLATTGKVALRLCKGGAMIYLPADAPQSKSVDSTLAKILGK